MSPIPTRDTPEGRAYNDLRNLAKQQRRDAAEYLALYVLEGFLVRLSRSTHAPNLVLKGGVLMAAFAARRPARDIDLKATGMANDIVEVEAMVAAIAAIPAGDGLMFDLDSIHGEPIRDDADYEGIRVHLTAHLSTAVIPFHVDVNFGDPIWPAPTTVALPRLLGGTVRLLGYPLHMALTEKIVTSIERGTANTRWRDFVDIASIADTTSVPAENLATAMQVVADFRRVTLKPLAEVLKGIGDIAQPKWTAWRRKQRLTDTTPAHFQQLVDACITFADPVITGSATHALWTPATHTWIAPTE